MNMIETRNLTRKYGEKTAVNERYHIAAGQYIDLPPRLDMTFRQDKTKSRERDDLSRLLPSWKHALISL